MGTPIGKFVLHRKSAGMSYGTLDGFFLMRTYGVATPEDVLATMNAHRAAIAFRPQGVAAIVVVETTTPLPSEPTREASIKVTRQTKGEVASQVLIVLGDGFWASAIRGLMTTSI